MKKETFYLIFTIIITANCNCVAQNWIEVTDTITDYFALKYSCPSKIEIDHLYNSIGFWHVIPDKQRIPNFPAKHIQWSIWFYHKDSITADQLISKYKKGFLGPERRIEKEEITLKSLGETKVTKYSCHYTKPKTIFLFFNYKDILIRLWGFNIRDFKKFTKSIQILELKNAP